MRRLLFLAALSPWLVAVNCDPAPATPEDTEDFPCQNSFDWADPGHPKHIDLYSWNGGDVIVVDRGCCDMYVEVIDAQTCEYLCAPEGGLSAGGDGRCPTFYDEATFVQTVYAE